MSTQIDAAASSSGTLRRWRRHRPTPRESLIDFEIPRTGTGIIRRATQMGEHAVLLIVCLISIAPLYVMVVTSLKSSQEFNSHPASLAPPAHLEFGKYAQAWNELGFSTMMQNSLILSVASSTVTTVVACIAGFALSRLRFAGRRLVLVSMVAFMSVPAIVVVVPLFGLMSSWGLVDSYIAAPLAEIGLSLPFAIFLVYTFMREIPEDLFAAAAVDGASSFQQLFKIALPLSRPVLLTVALITGIFAWNDLLIPLVLWQSQQMQVLMVGLANLAPGHEGSVDIPLVMAGVGISVLPVVVLFLLARKLFIQGFLGGALKS